jgi:hypothetical protein
LLPIGFAVGILWNSLAASSYYCMAITVALTAASSATAATFSTAIAWLPF